MAGIQIAGLAVLATFYAAYFFKMFLQRCHGITTNQIGAGPKPEHVLRTERMMKLATYAVVPAELICILWPAQTQSALVCWIGIGVSAIGVLAFILAMAAMQDSWRAGIPASDRTELVTTGIYRLSRNPAFWGFDLMYLGLLTTFFHPVHLLLVISAIIMLHLQILQEERFLAATFGESYRTYRKRTGRYFIV